MAGEARTPDGALAVREDLAARTHALEFFEALRRVECLWPDKPRIGTATRPADEPLRLGQDPSLDFPGSMLSSIASRDDGKLAIRCNFLGLFGPQGPLPLHLTECARERAVSERDSTLVAFVDMFHHRMLEFFYRAWAEAQPTTHFDRPGDDRFAGWIAALLGFAGEQLRDADAWPDQAKLYFAGHLSAATRTRDALESLLAVYLELPVQVEECVGEWLGIAPSEQFCLGRGAQSGRLGLNTVLGQRTWNAQSKLRLVVGPVGVSELMQFLPGGASLERLRALMLNYLGHEYAWDMRFKLKRESLPGVQPGQFGHLGWTTWLAPKPTGGDVDDVIIDVSERTVLA